MKLLISYLTNDRRHYTFPHFINLLKKSLLTNEWKLMIMTNSHDEEFYINHLQNTNINFEIVYTEFDDNYIKKVRYVVDYATKNNIPFIMKCDNDVFLKPDVLDYMIQNLEILNNSRHLTLGPVVTSGIPGIEYFKEDFLDEDSQIQIEKYFLETEFYNRDGCEYYEKLNKYTIDSNKWDKNSFFDEINNMDHHYKGIHPIRVNCESLHFLNDYIIKNKKRFFQDNEMSIINNDNAPYLCNSIFCIKTDTYKNIVNDHSLHVDGFDEVPLNKYAWNNNMNHAFVRHGYAIHMYYNWTPEYLDKEITFCNDIFD